MAIVLGHTTVVQHCPKYDRDHHFRVGCQEEQNPTGVDADSYLTLDSALVGCRTENIELIKEKNE
jgi:hypothetical protein